MSKDSGHRSVQLGVTLLRESIATLRAAAAPLTPTRPLPSPSPLPGRVPVVLVHGFMGHKNLLRPLAVHLLNGGWPAVERVGYSSFSIDFEQIIDRIDEAVRSVGSEGRVDLIGHSLGAIACRAYIRMRDEKRWVRRFVALGAPFAGTSLYRVVPSAIRAVLDPRGPWVRSMTGPEPVPTTVIRARYDTQVFPPNRASLPGVREIVIDGHGHNGLLWCEEAHRAVAEALSAP